MSDTMVMMLVAVAAELVLLLFVLLTIAVLRGRSAKKRDADAMRALVDRVKKEKPRREQAIEDFLSHGMAMSGDALDQAKVAMLRAELALVQRFVSVYRSRDAVLAGRFDGDVIAALEPYHALSGTTVVATGGDSEVTAVDNTELEALRKENNRLEDELRITMETMSRMLNEYSTMFAGGAPDHAAPIGGAAAASVPVDEASADEIAEFGGPPGDDALDAEEVPDVEMAEEDDSVAADAVREDAAGDVDNPFDESIESPFETDEAVASVMSENLNQLFDEIPEESGEVDSTDIGEVEENAVDDVVEDIGDAGDLFDAIEEAALPEPEPEPEPGPEADITAETETTPAEAPDIDEEDPIAQILREAQSQEQSARDHQVDVVANPTQPAANDGVDAAPEGGAEPDGVTVADNVPGDVVEVGAQLEEGEVEVMTFAEDDIEIEVADDELFDTVDIGAAEFDAQPPSAESAGDLFDAVDDDRKRGSGN